MVEISKITFIKLQSVSINILNRYPTLTSSLCMLFSIDDLWQGHFHIEFVIFVNKYKNVYLVEFYYQSSFLS